jgi:hypothetical protein
MAFEVLMRDCATEEDRRQSYAVRLEAEEVRIARVTLAMARAGDYERLIDAMDYRENYKMAMRALVLCAAKGNVEATEAVDTLARTYAELHAEVD